MLLWVASLSAAGLLMGCEEDIATAPPTERPFSLYGVFSPQMDTQWVRVYAVEGRLEPIRPEPLDARFTTTDLQTNEMWVWRDSLIREADGSWAHVFWSPFSAAYGHPYRVAVASSEEAVSTVAVHVPPRTELVLQEPERFPHVLFPVLVEGAAPRLMKIEFEYHVKFKDGPPEETTLLVPISYDGKEQQVAAGWLIPLSFSTDFRAIRDLLQRTLRNGEPLWDPAYGVALLEVILRLAVVSADWVPPGGAFDPEVLVEPGVMSNVENGFGFVGAGYRHQRAWRPPEEILQEAGFRPLTSAPVSSP